MTIFGEILNSVAQVVVLTVCSHFLFLKCTIMIKSSFICVNVED